MKIFNPFEKPSPALLAVEELEDAQRQLLAALTARDYAAAMVTYNRDRVARLTATIQEKENDL